MLAVSGLTKRFDDMTVFEDFGLTVPRGGFTVLIGPSGCGKSTLFDVLTGVHPKNGGTISWRGAERPHLRQDAAYMQQNDLLLPWLSLIDNAMLPARLRRSPMPQAEEKVRQLFGRLGLGGFERHLPRQISGGMRQRCALVRTLMFERELVLLDEPLSSLDAITRSRLQALLLLLQSDFSRSLLMITHDIEEALLLADHLLVLTRMPMTVREAYVLDRPKPRRTDDPALLKIKTHVLDRLTEDGSDVPG